MKEKDSFIFYGSFFEALQDLKDKDRLQAYDAICDLGLHGNERKLTGIAKTVFTLIKPQVLANNKRYEDGKKGGRPKKITSGFENVETIDYEIEKTSGFEKIKPNVNVNENVNVNDNKKEIKKEKSNHFQKPTIEEIKEYCEERNNGINPNMFYNFYESKGWRVGNQPMKDWKACVRTWEQKNKENNSKTQFDVEKITGHKVGEEYVEQGFKFRQLEDGSRIVIGVEE